MARGGVSRPDLPAGAGPIRPNLPACDERRMKTVKLGQPIPDVELKATDGRVFRLSELRGKHLVLYFYPKDNTPGCTTEGQDFRDRYEEFHRLNTEILGVSRDSLKSHEGFKAKHCLPFDLVADEDGTLCQLFDVIREKSLYGRRYQGIERSTFVIDKHGVLHAEYRGVKVAGHAEAMLAEARKLG
jgi:peroxiredoxin Q/BCP